MTDFTKTLIRCSAIGSIMTNPKGSITEKQLKRMDELFARERAGTLTEKMLETLEELTEKKLLSAQLSESAKKYLVKAYAIEKYNRIPDVTTKQMVKGTTAEDAAIDLFSFIEDRAHEKNRQQLRNDFICGTPDLFDGKDILESDEVIDVKCSWDIFTFLANISNPFNQMYYYQLQGYMALTGAKKGTLAYCLVNTPDEMINQEKKNAFFRMQCVTEEDPRFKARALTIERNMIFDDIPAQERVLKYSIDRDDAVITQIYEKVKKCREFLLEFEKEHLFFTKGFRKELGKVLSLPQTEAE
jgi:hypothetical protein